MIKQPNCTQVPNELLDAMSDMSGDELKVALSIIRGVYSPENKSEVSLSQICTSTGLSRDKAVFAARQLCDRGCIWMSRTTDAGYERYAFGLEE